MTYNKMDKKITGVPAKRCKPTGFWGQHEKEFN
jgi:hypothetical protein